MSPPPWPNTLSRLTCAFDQSGLSQPPIVATTQIIPVAIRFETPVRIGQPLYHLRLRQMSHRNNGRSDCSVIEGKSIGSFQAARTISFGDVGPFNGTQIKTRETIPNDRSVFL